MHRSHCSWRWVITQCKVNCLVLNPLTNRWKVTVQGCIWSSSRPDEAYIVHWSTIKLRARCLFLGKENPVNMTVSSAGLTCADLGDVIRDPHQQLCGNPFEGLWAISYIAPNVPYSGSANLDWLKDPMDSVGSTNVTLKEFREGTSICVTESHCSSTSLLWSGDGIRQVWVNI